MSITIGIAAPEERDAIAALYTSTGYRRGLSDGDEYVVARDGVRVIGVVRKCSQHGVWVLRGMRVLPEHQRQGIGTRMLRAFVSGLDSTTCYCVPYTHLESFYAQVGFNRLAESDAPEFLRLRVQRYKQEGADVVLMSRPHEI